MVLTLVWWEWQALDDNDSGGIDFGEMAEGLARLNVTPKIFFTEEDFDMITDNRRLCSPEGKRKSW